MWNNFEHAHYSHVRIHNEKPAHDIPRRLELSLPCGNLLKAFCKLYELGNSGQKKMNMSHNDSTFLLWEWRTSIHRCILRWVLAFPYISELPVIEDIKHSRESLVWKLRWCSWVCSFQQKNYKVFFLEGGSAWNNNKIFSPNPIHLKTL